MPKVSVIIPTYNRGYIVREGIDSVLCQTIRDIELLAVNDGATDNTKNIVEGIKDSRVGYFYKLNGGPASAHNFGLVKAVGEYIT